ncbi:MAG: LamG-like jellyroll fold domain-containing protein, partial [Sedimentisphaerales bacterium]
MFRKLLHLSSLVLVLALAGHIRAAQEPVAHYQFEGVNDFSNTGTDSAAITGEPKGGAQIIWDDDRGSYVLSLAADGDFVHCQRSWQGIVATEMTAMAWIKTSSLNSTGIIAGLGYAWRLSGGSGGNVAFQVNGTSPVSAAVGTIPVDDGTWHHVAGAYDGTEYKLYIDGRTNVSVASSGVLDGGATAYYGTIGAHYKRSDPAPKQYFNGLIDDVRIYNRVLSEEEILGITGFSGVKAVEPSPPDGRQLDVVDDVVLSWKPGVEADKHDVYFGDSLDGVTAADTITDPRSVYKGRQDPNQYAVGETLGFGKTYYWRIDEVESGGITVHKGNVWQFTAEPFGYQIPGSVITATASSFFLDNTEPEKTIDGSGLDGDLHSTNMEDMWLSSFVGPQPTWIEFQFDKVYKLHEMWVWNQNQAIESSIGYGFKNVSIEYSLDGINYTTLGTTHEFAQSPGTPDCVHDTTVDLSGVTAKYVRLTANSNWSVGGWLSQYGLSEVRFHYIPIWAREPDPADGAINVDPDVVLGWRAGREAATHNVHLDIDREVVLNGTASVGSVTEPAYDAGTLDLSQTYFWRVDEVDEAQSPALEGELWSFTTPDYLIVEDFEDYNDYPPREIWTTWKDGYETANNGSTVGHPNPNWSAGEHYVETTIVHGGDQSMPLLYDNNFKYSEAKRVLSPAQDWTK